ncbi:MAG: hypothetical protein J07HB67_02274 [halophilic archaeon J07HB67]|nr:MAG: hypothetical protein J07HB67_02274 [halophilic archaeon J07HB67]
MVREPVAGSRHVQRQTSKRWCGGYEGDVLDAAIDDLVSIGLVREKGRGTVTLKSVQDGKRFLERFDSDDEYVWFY